MTPKEKAKELVEKFLPYMDQDRDATFKQRFTDAKQCALIAIDLVMQNNRELLESQLNNDFSIMDNSIDWRLIKAEIEKL